MSALFRKELRDLWLWGLLAALIGALDVADILLQQVDMQPLGVTFDEVTDAGGVLFWLMAFAIGTGLTTRELDDGTLSFLDGLPVSRTRVFFVKCSVTFGLVLLAPAMRLMAAGLLHLLSHGSLDSELHGLVLVQVFASQSLLILNGIVLGAAFGRLRSLAWAAAGASAFAVILLARNYPRAVLLDPTTLLDVELTSAGLAIDGELVAVQVFVTVAALGVAWRGFVGAGPSRLLAAANRPVVGAAISAFTVVAIGAVAITLAVDRDSETGGAYVSDEPYFYPSPPAQTVTEHYRISYASDSTQRALAVAKEADVVFKEVHRLLGAELGAIIDVDASGSQRNTHGTAYYSRIRMELNDDAIAILAHETAHVVAQRLAGDAKDWLWQEASVLNEGLADWVMAHFDAELHSSAAGLFILAAMHQRRELLLEELADGETFGRLRDEDIKYPAGKALIDAMVKLYGTEAVPRLLRAFADERLPTDLRGLELWQAAFQSAGMNLGAVVDEFYREISAYGEQHADRIVALPRPRVRLVTDGEQFGVQVLVDEPMQSGQSLRVRFKPAPDSPRQLIDEAGAWPHEPVWREDFAIVGGRICVQAGLWLTGDQVLYEPWTCLPTRGAVEWTPPPETLEVDP